MSGTGRFGPDDRLHRPSEYQRVSQAGDRRASGSFVLLRAPRAAGSAPRLGITASRRVGNAVTRNRIKRAVREWFRTRREAFAGPCDMVVIARRGAARLQPLEAARELDALVAELAR